MYNKNGINLLTLCKRPQTSVTYSINSFRGKPEQPFTVDGLISAEFLLDGFVSQPERKILHSRKSQISIVVVEFVFILKTLSRRKARWQTLSKTDEMLTIMYN